MAFGSKGWLAPSGGHARSPDGASDRAQDGSLDQLVATITSGAAMLFTGAGFSACARSLNGNYLPDERQMLAELWALVFGDLPRDDSTLADVYEVALVKHPQALASYLVTRQRVGPDALPSHYAIWFSAPWRRIYTLNVDDLERAVQRQFVLPRRLRPISAWMPTAEVHDAIDVVHLNGIAGEPADELVFSTAQYAARLGARQHYYEQLVTDLATAPFVFVGTTLDEVVLRQRVTLHRRGVRKLGETRSFLVSPQLSRARRELLVAMGITWIPATAAELASQMR